MQYFSRLSIVTALTMAVLPVAGNRAAAQQSLMPELGVTYSFVHTNAPPQNCGCFPMNGGGVSLAWPVRPHWSLAGEADVVRASHISPGDSDLTLSTYLVGTRYKFHPLRAWQPFAELLVGAGHSSGSLAPGSSGLPGSPTAFALSAGGGVDVRVSTRIAIRVAQLDYLPTVFGNGRNDHQNNVRFRSGVTFHF